MTIADKPVLLPTSNRGIGHAPVKRWRAFALLAVAFLMTIIDLTIVNVSLPTIGRDLHFSQTNLQWVVTAYALTFGGFLLLGGRAADLFGRRRILMGGLSLFTAASLACGLASSEGFLIVARAIQGLGAAIMVPSALSIVMNMFREGAERNKALGIWGGLGASGATAEQQEPAERERIRRYHPLQAGVGEMQIAADRRQRDVDDRQIDDRHEVGHGQQRERAPAMGIS